MSEEDIQLDNPITKFGTYDDAAFVVEVKNTTDKPIKLLDTRYGTSFGKSSGKPNSDWYGQYLFSLDVFDGEGKKLEFARTDMVGANFPAESALAVSLEAGKTHRFLLRPAKWLRIMSPWLQPGSYRIAIRYRGIPASTAEQLQIRVPGHTNVDAWSGDVVSPQVAISIAGAKSPVQNTWGEPKNGVRTAIRLAPAKSDYKSGDKPKAILRMQNVSKNVVTVATGLWQSELKMRVKDQAGKEHRVSHTFYSGWTLVGRVTLKPKQTIEIDAGNIGLSVSEEHEFEDVTNRRLTAPPGTYRLRFKDLFGGFQLSNGKGKVLAPLNGDWTGELETGALTITLAE